MYSMAKKKKKHASGKGFFRLIECSSHQEEVVILGTHHCKNLLLDRLFLRAYTLTMYCTSSLLTLCIKKSVCKHLSCYKCPGSNINTRQASNSNVALSYRDKKIYFLIKSMLNNK